MGSLARSTILLRGFAPSREIDPELRTSCLAAFHDRDCRATMARNVEQLSSTALARNQNRLRQSFYNWLVATLEEDCAWDL